MILANIIHDDEVARMELSPEWFAEKGKQITAAEKASDGDLLARLESEMQAALRSVYIKKKIESIR